MILLLLDLIKYSVLHYTCLVAQDCKVSINYFHPCTDVLVGMGKLQ